MSDKQSNGGCGFLVSLFCVLLGVLFIGLKLGAVIDWEWWVVLSPLWIPVGLFLLVLLGILGIAVVAAVAAAVAKDS